MPKTASIYSIARRCFSLIIFLSAFNFSACEQPQFPDKKVIVIDSANISGWELIPSKTDEGSKYKIVLHNNLWMMSTGENAPAEVDRGYLNRSFRHIQNLYYVKKFSADKSSWDTMGLSDKGTRLNIFTKNGKTHSLILGNMFFLDNKATYYVRPADGEKIYIVQQYIDGSLKAPADKFRKKELVPVTPLEMGDILFLNPDGIDFILKKAGRLNWEIDSILTDDSTTVKYLQKLSGLSVSNFAAQPSSGVELSMEIKTLTGNSIWLRASRKNNETWILSSSANQGNYMALNSSEISNLFPSKSYFIKPIKK